MSVLTNPTVSLAIIAYNAEKYIAEAIEGALSQSYGPLEIILSDDNSPDRTFEIMQQCAENYKGPHTVVLNKNPNNLGLSGHLNKLFFEVAKGDWIVVNAGDDVSKPSRVEEIMKVAEDDVSLIHHGFVVIDDNSKEYGDWHPSALVHEVFNNGDLDLSVRTNVSYNGQTACYNSKLFRHYGPVNPDVVYEDKVWSYRAIHFGKVKYVDKPLLKYRRHEQSITHTVLSWTKESYINYKRKYAQNNYSVYRQILSEQAIKFNPETLDLIRIRLKNMATIGSLYGAKLLEPPTIEKLSTLYIREKIKFTFLSLYINAFNATAALKNRMRKGDKKMY